MGQLWLQDCDGQWFKCLNCNATGEEPGERKRETAVVFDFAAARHRRDKRDAVSLAPPPEDGNAA